MAARIAEPVSPAPLPATLPATPPATLPDGLPPAPPHPRPEDIRVVAFDCYGTLLDFDERGFAPAVDGLLREHGVTHTSGEAVWEAWTDHARDLAKSHGRDPDHPLAGPEPPFIPFAESWTTHFAHAFRETAVEGSPRATRRASCSTCWPRRSPTRRSWRSSTRCARVRRAGAG